MTARNTSLIETHLEKMVITAAAIFVIAVVWFYYLGNPYGITLNNQPVQPSDVEEVVMRPVQQLDTMLRGESRIPELAAPAYSEEAAARLRQPLMADESVAMAWNLPGIDPATAVTTPAQRPQYHVPPVPVASDLKTKAEYFVLAAPYHEDPRVQQQILEAYRKLIGPQEPRDFWAVRVQGSFPNEAWLKALGNPPVEAGNVKPMPEDWYRKYNMLVDVRLERQTLDPATGRWGDVQVVPTGPELPSFRGFDVVESRAEGDDLRRELAINQDLIRRSEFPLTDGKVWTEGDVELGKLSPEDQRRFVRIEADLTRLREQIRRLERAAAGGRPEGSPEPAPRPRPGPGGFVEPGMDEFSEPPAPTPGPRGPAPAGSRLEQLRQRYNQLLLERQRIINPDADPAEIEPQFMGDEFDRDPRDPRGPRGLRDPRGPWVEGDPDMPAADARAELPASIDLRAFDLTAKPGRTYRYRMVVDIYNPLFQRTDVSDEQRQQYHDRLKLSSTPSPWTEPVRIEAPIRYFVTRANSQPPSATVEVWRIFNGRRERREYQVQPGDQVGQVEQIALGLNAYDVEFTVPAILVDVPRTTGAFDDRVCLFLNTTAGQFVERSANRDRDSVDRARFITEQAMAEALARVGGATGDGDRFAP